MGPRDRQRQRDVIFGPLASVFSLAAAVLAYFSLALRLGRGRIDGRIDGVG